MAKKKRKSLPRGNLRVVSNEAGRRERERRPVNARIEMGDGRGGTGFSLPVASYTKPPYEYNVRPGFEEAALPLEGPPGSEWWNDPKYKGRR